MPGMGFSYYYTNKSKLIAEWKEKYIAKGCSPTKAQALAYKKVKDY